MPRALGAEVTGKHVGRAKRRFHVDPDHGAHRIDIDVIDASLLDHPGIVDKYLATAESLLGDRKQFLGSVR